MGNNRRSSESQRERRESRGLRQLVLYIVLYWLYINIYVIEGSLFVHHKQITDNN